MRVLSRTDPEVIKNQLLQLCTDLTAWSDSVIMSASAIR